MDRVEQNFTPGDKFFDSFISGDGRGPEMIVLPARDFIMGSPSCEAGRWDNEGPQRTIRMRDYFAMGQYQLTFAEWDACVADGGGNGHRPDDQGWGRGNLPVINVSWYDAQAYVTWLNDQTGLTDREDCYRLPSEAEWEFAARAGAKTAYCFGSDASQLENFAWLDENSGNRTQAVGGKLPNAFGLFDMHGNVWEWVEDSYVEKYSAGQPSNGEAFIASVYPLRVNRGGSHRDGADFLRCATRGRDVPRLRSKEIGFRLARTLPRTDS